VYGCRTACRVCVLGARVRTELGTSVRHYACVDFWRNTCTTDLRETDGLELGAGVIRGGHAKTGDVASGGVLFVALCRAFRHLSHK